MDKFSYALVKCAATVFGARAPVWEIGAYRVEGQEEYGDLREIFPGYEYVGCDMREGPRVDRVEDVTALSAADGAVPTLLCLNTLEHVYDIRKGFAEIARAVADDGMAVISLPFYFKVHDYPGDFWRMTPEALERATAGFPWRIIGSRGWETTPTAVFCIGFKREPADFAHQYDRFMTCLAAEGRETRSIAKRIKARIGYHLLSKRAFRGAMFKEQVRAKTVTSER